MASRIRATILLLAPVIIAGAAAGQPPRDPQPIRADKANAVSFPAQEARLVRFVITASTSGQPCLDELEVWAGPENDYLLMRKSDGWTVTIPRIHVDDYLSDDKPTKEKGRASLIDAFHRFKEPAEE